MRSLGRDVEEKALRGIDGAHVVFEDEGNDEMRTCAVHCSFLGRRNGPLLYDSVQRAPFLAPMYLVTAGGPQQ